MNAQNLDLGIYLNLFEVEISSEKTVLYTAPREIFPELNSLRSWLSSQNLNVYLYAWHDKVYGYGADANVLENAGFQQSESSFQEVPQVTSRMILQGYSSMLFENGFRKDRDIIKGRLRMYKTKPLTIIENAIKIYEGVDLRTIFIKDPVSDDLFFGMIIDMIYKFRDITDNPISPQDIANKYGKTMYIKVKQVQKEFLSDGKINPECSRERFYKIKNFVEKYNSFKMPCGVNATLSCNPVRIIVGGDEY